MTDYPLIKQMGLELRELYSPPHNSFGKPQDLGKFRCVDADDLERALAAAPVVYKKDAPGHVYSPLKNCDDTHTARLLCVQPIVRDTAESLLRDLLEEYDKVGEYSAASDKLRKRATQFLTSIGESK